MTRWTSFLQQNRGKKFSMAELSAKYKSEKQLCVVPHKNRYSANDSEDESQQEHYGGNGKDFRLRREENQVYFCGGLDETSCSTLKQALGDAVQHCKGKGSVLLHLQSTGGSVLATLAVIDFIKAQKVPIDCHVDGYAFSCGALLTVACHKRFINPNSVMLVHPMKVSLSRDMKPVDLDREVYNIKVLHKLADAVLLKHSKLTSKKLRELEEHDHLLTAAECIKYGLVDKIV